MQTQKAATISNILCRLIEHDQYLCENKIDKKKIYGLRIFVFNGQTDNKL